MPPRISLQKVVKVFKVTTVLNDVSIDIFPGEIVGLLGANGAGKSTLMKILMGIYQPTSGDVLLNGKNVPITSPAVASAHKINLIPQELGLVPALTGLQNIMLGSEPTKAGWLDENSIRQNVCDLIDSFEVAFDLDVPVENLTSGQQQIVAIVRALARESETLIFDEPTAMLTDSEAKILLKIVQSLAQKGMSIIYISHRLDEIDELCNRVVILRGGRKVYDGARSVITRDEIVGLMVSVSAASALAPDETSNTKRLPKNVSDKPILQVHNLSTLRLKHATFTLNRGEILGVIGLVGGGRSELMHAIAGIDEVIDGSVQVEGKIVTANGVSDFESIGVYLSPEDRRRHGLFLDQSVGFNCLIRNHEEFTRWGFFWKSAYRKSFELARGHLGVKVSGPGQNAEHLSGGNQQRLILGRILARPFEIVLLDEVTSGVDVMTKKDILNQVRNIAEAGRSVIFVSSDWREVFEVSHRVLVIHGGRILADLRNENLSPTECMHIIAEAKAS